jgi:hypothetical protein
MIPLLPLLFAAAAAVVPLRAGVARVDITPREPMRMAGYAARTHPSTGVAERLWAKALAIQDQGHGPVVIVTLDLLRAPRILTDAVADEAARRYGLRRSQLLFNCSHNHSGPLLWEDDPFPSVSDVEYAVCRRYMESLTRAITGLVGQALADMAPAVVTFSSGTAGFAANRRVPGAKGYEIGYNPAGPVDHRVPVLRVSAPDGSLRALLFGYACHNTAIGPGSYNIAGDYAGAAQRLLEEAHPGATALFLQLAAGDQDPHPRGDRGMAEQHGRALAGAVDKALASPQRRIEGPIGTAFRIEALPLGPHTRASFEARLADPNPAQARNARRMLKAYDDGRPIVSVDYPVQAVRFGETLSLVAIGGEPVVDYALRAGRELPGVVLAGYSNSVRGYVPSERVLGEGGYEAGDSAPYYGLPAPFAPGLEERIFRAIRAVLHESLPPR